MVNFKTLDDLDLNGRRALVRVDLNVPMNKGKITDQTRAERVIPTIEELLEKGAGVILASHLGRPRGRVVPDYSLEQLMPILQILMPNRNITFSPDGNQKPKPGEIILLENLRFNLGEENNDQDFSKFLSGLADVYIKMNDLDKAMSLIEKALLIYPSDSNLYKLLAKVHTKQKALYLEYKNLGEYFYFSFDLKESANQMSLAINAPDANFYDKSKAEQRLKEIKAEIAMYENIK